MRLTLCLPGLLLPRQALLDTVADLELPALSRLLGQGRLLRDVPAEHYDRLMQRWNLNSLPAAALRLLGEGCAPGRHEWLCLDPVHLSVNRRGVKLEDPAALALTAEEDAALRATLAPHFSAYGELSSAVPGHWHLRLADICELVNLPLPQAAGYAVDPALPSGRDGMRWRRLLAEAQSLLHDHPVNRAREAAGKPVVNSLWPWGPGQLATPLSAPFDAIWSSDPLLLGLAHASGVAGSRPPPAYEHADGDILAVIDDLTAAARSLDALAWREALARLERDWFAPLTDALRRGRCRTLHVVAFGPDASVDIHIARHDLLKFWRRPQALTRLAA
ncbi:MAG: hypothetical protein Q7U97_14100 [Rhodocyclaceae bacterium]|nr:hypothetical protein [Rhodocyclaceae bacterium]